MSDLHTVIIAAGCSKRLEELTRDKPKSFLEVGGKKIMEHNLDILSNQGCKDVTLVVGYLKEMFIKTFGNTHKNLRINYITADDYETTGHSVSVFLTRAEWEKQKKSVLLVHGDVFCHPKIFESVISSEHENVLAIDNHYTIQTGDECLVRGKDSLVTSVEFNAENDKENIRGEIVGINKWSPALMESFYDHMEKFFEQKGRKASYEVVLNSLLQEQHPEMHYVETDGLPWININYKADYKTAQKLHSEIYG